jgi:hypothetical protein
MIYKKNETISKNKEQKPYIITCQNEKNPSKILRLMLLFRFYRKARQSIEISLNIDFDRKKTKT